MTEICPGQMATNFFKIAFNNLEKSTKAFDDYKALESEDIANAIIYAIIYAVNTPWWVSIQFSTTEQTFGGMGIIPAPEWISNIIGFPHFWPI